MPQQFELSTSRSNITNPSIFRPSTLHAGAFDPPVSLQQQPLNTNPTFSKILQTDNISLNTSQSQKRVLQNQNNNTNKAPKQIPKNQLQLKNFNSFDPSSPNTDIDVTNTAVNGFRIAGRNKNSNNPDLNKNKKQFKQKTYASSMGRDEFNILKAKSKQFYIYLGRIDTSESIESVKKFLITKLKNVRFNDNKEKDVSFSNLKELNSENKERTFSSFVFSVDYLDKDIIDMKSLWPLYSIVNKYKMPFAEWSAIAQKNKIYN